MILLILALLACFVVSALFLAEVLLWSWLAVLIAIPVSFAVTYALGRVLRNIGAV